jgi:D-alanyl-D-alanine carboxypeptidase
MGRKNKLLRIFAIAGLAVSFWFFRIAEYMKKGTKRFACAVFALLCFMVGSSFAYPVFQEENGFVAEAEAGSEAVPAVSEDATITLAEDDMTVPEDIPVLDDDVMEDYDAELHGMETADKYSLSEILKEDGDEEITQTVPEEENSEISFSEDDWKLVLINKQHPIPDDYEFTLGNIKTIKGTMQCDERIIDELLAMMQDALEDGVTLAICSPYRDFNYQQNLFNNHIKDYMKRGMSYMDAYTLSSQAVTVPGASEHQIGLAIDIVSDDYVTLDAGFADTDAGRWLAEHSWEYGFILRYPLGREYITGIEFEPWHFRYVGKDAAGIITEEGISLEEFWDKYL